MSNVYRSVAYLRFNVEFTQYGNKWCLNDVQGILTLRVCGSSETRRVSLLHSLTAELSRSGIQCDFCLALARVWPKQGVIWFRDADITRCPWDVRLCTDSLMSYVNVQQLRTQFTGPNIEASLMKFVSVRLSMSIVAVRGQLLTRSNLAALLLLPETSSKARSMT